MVFSKEVRLNGTEQEKIKQILQLAGWYEHRCVDITIVEKYYAKHHVLLVEAAKNFFREYYGLAGLWEIKSKLRTESYGALDSRGPFIFFLFPRGDWRELKTYTPSGALLYETFSEYLPTLTSVVKENVTLIGEIGYYFPSRVWIGESGKFYVIHEGMPEDVYIFHSLPELIEGEFPTYNLISVCIRP